ncbi:unnamed protein product [Bursaphelenchus xylophilus]|uniref:(pine wood nematode) hypothetical protein n=1 Tax=Bursaphelenchus xylophilus TaxID=6326 RepID=A0A1I7SUI2_BURXY|nr:unnamed protein product [Bursaphelenchus xylophilus]CAG9107100.1 unnamed protein product [Bursaphelenchus xylophilus]
MGKNKKKRNQNETPISSVETKVPSNGSNVVKDEPTVTNNKDTGEEKRKKVLNEIERRKKQIEDATKPIPKEAQYPRITFYPFAYALSEKFLDKACWYCLQLNVQLSYCTNCKVARFCSEKCEELAKKDHQPECRGYKKSKNKDYPNIEVRLLGRICSRYNMIKKGEDKAKDFYLERTSKRSVMEIWAHEQDFAEHQDYTTQFMEIYDKLIRFYHKDDLPSKKDVFKLHCRDFINRHAICDKNYENEIGKGLYLDLCAYDHSCKPDTVFFSDGFKSILAGLHKTKDISDPNKSFYSYIDLLGTFDQRQKQLRDTWFFECKCERCLDPKDHILTSIKCQFCANRDVESTIIVQGALAPRKEGRLVCPNCDIIQEPFHIMECNYTIRDIGLFLDNMDQIPEHEITAHFELFKQKGVYCLPKQNVYRARLLLQYASRISTNDEEKAMLMWSVEDCLRHCFPQNHPGLSYFLKDLAFYCKQAGFFKDSVKYYVECLQGLERIFVTHPLIQEIRDLLPGIQKRMIMEEQKGKTKILSNLDFEFDESDQEMPELIECKVSNGSSKERAQHRRSHRAPTPLPPEPVEEE